MSDVEQIMKQYQDMFPKLDTEIIWSIMFEYLEKPNGNEQTLDKLVEISSNFDEPSTNTEKTNEDKPLFDPSGQVHKSKKTIGKKGYFQIGSLSDDEDY
jgi:hypothetical protein